MAIKNKDGGVEPTSIQMDDEWEGAWGTISPTAHSATTLRVIVSSESVDYPYRLIGKRTLAEADRDTLMVEAAGEKITISGRGLRRLADAISNETLEVVREQGEVEPDVGNPGHAYIFSIKIEEAAP